MYLDMFRSYIDDSGTDPKQAVATATALIIPGRTIPSLEVEWNQLCRKFKFSGFHTSEFVCRNPKSDFANMDDATQAHVFERVRTICKKYGVFSVSVTVNKTDYDEIVPRELRQHTGKHHYTWAVRSLLVHLARWRWQYSPTIPWNTFFLGWASQRKTRGVRK